MAASQEVHKILTKYFICINQGHYMIYLQYMKFVRSTLWPGGAYTDTAHAKKAKIMIPYSDEIMNHDYIGSFWQCQMSQKVLSIIYQSSRLWHLRVSFPYRYDL